MGKALGFLGHLNDIGLKIQNVGHGCHLLSHTSLTRHRGMLYSATRFSNQFERHSTNQRTGGWRTATPIANHPPHTGNQSRNPDQGHHFTHPGKPASSLPYCAVHAELSSPANPPADPTGPPLGFLGHLNDIGLKIQNVSHDLSPPPTHCTDQTIGICSPAPPSSRTNSSGTQRTRGQVVGERRHPSPTTHHIRETRVETPIKVTTSPIQANQLPHSPTAQYMLNYHRQQTHRLTQLDRLLVSWVTSTTSV